MLDPYPFSRREGAPTLEAIATAHIEAMRGVQAQGPYRLGGFCNGGLLAYEMARQLEAQGERVEFLGLINPSKPVQFSLLRAVCNGLSGVGRAGKAGQVDRYLRARHALRHVYRRLRPEGSRVQDFGQLLAIEPQLSALFPPPDALYKDYVGVLSWAAAAYKTGTVGAKITFYWARDEPAIARRWQPLIKGKQPADIEEHIGAGTHMASVTDGIDELAKTIGDCLTRLDQENCTIKQIGQ